MYLFQVRVTEFRRNEYYITYYWMWTRLLATGVIPLVVLALLNTKIFLSIRQSKQQLRDNDYETALNGLNFFWDRLQS